MSNSLQPHELYRPWNSPDQNTGVSCCSLLQGIFPTQGSNPGLPHCRQILYQLSHKGSPFICYHSVVHQALLSMEFSRQEYWSGSISSVAQSHQTLCDPMDCSTPGFPIHHQLDQLMSIELVMPSNHLILCCPLLLLTSVFPSVRVFSNESVLHIRWPKYWSFSFSISPSNEYSGLTSFRMDWLDLLAVQGTLKSLLQHHVSKASILWYSAFFIVQLSHPYMTTRKTIALTRWTFVGRVMSLLLNMLSRLLIAFLPRSKRLLISWLQSPSATILEPNSLSLFPLFPHLFAMKWWDRMPWS